MAGDAWARQLRSGDLMPRIAFIGAGSLKFVATLCRDLFSFPELHDSHICLMDIDADRMGRSERFVRKMIEERNLPATVESTTDQRRALERADFVLITVMVGGWKHYDSDAQIPMKYGLLPSVGDTIGPGAMFRLIRTGPVLRQLVKNLKELSPNAWVLNYSNPMAMNTWLMLSDGHARTVGLCHSIQAEYKTIAKWLNLPADEIRYTAGGINHINFYLTLEHKGQSLYPALLEQKSRILAEHPSKRVKFELLEYLGGWPAEGEFHQNEYYPWFHKNQEMVTEYASKVMWGHGHDRYWHERLSKQFDDQIAVKIPIDYRPSHEYGAFIIHSIQTNQSRVFHGNVRNAGLIENLPPQAVVEVPCHVDGVGIAPCQVGRIPMPLAAVMNPHIAVHEMAVEAVVRRDRRLVHQAIQADPLTAAVLSLPKISEMVEELFEENREYLDGWR
jgi:alpha-galactosidase